MELEPPLELPNLPPEVQEDGVDDGELQTHAAASVPLITQPSSAKQCGQQHQPLVYRF
jgi:hypothetical protein